MIVPSNHTTIGDYSLEHNERYDIIIGKKSGTFSFHNKPLETFYLFEKIERS